MPADFLPHPQWRPAEHWGPPPPGWVFYTKNGQPAMPPPHLWSPFPAKVASRTTQRSTVDQADPAPGEPGGTQPQNNPHPGRGRRILLAVVVVAVVALIFGILGVRALGPGGRDLTQQEFQFAFPVGAPLGPTIIESSQMTAPGSGQLTAPEGAEPCLTAMLEQLDSVGQASTTSGGSSNVNSNTGLVEGDKVDLWAVRLPTSDDADDLYDRLSTSREASKCFQTGERPFEEVGRTSLSPQSEVYGDEFNTYALVERRNIVGLVIAATKATEGGGDRLVKQISDYVDAAGGG
jgi:hypothetical protein